jgi:hypothetical protein
MASNPIAGTIAQVASSTQRPVPDFRERMTDRTIAAWATRHAAAASQKRIRFDRMETRNLVVEAGAPLYDARMSASPGFAGLAGWGQRLISGELHRFASA